MNKEEIQITPNVEQKYVVVAVNEGNELLLRGDPDAEWHKDIVKKITDSGVKIADVKGGGRVFLDTTDQRIYIYDRSSNYGEVPFKLVRDLLLKQFKEYSIESKPLSE